MSDHPCKVPGCGTKDADKPQIFRGEDWCSDLHRKMLIGELPMPTQHDGPPGRGGVVDTRSF